MSKQISIINPYSEKENQITNYLGLILKYIYKESNELFEEAIKKLCYDSEIQADDTLEELELFPKFEQQRKLTDSIPDLTISQPSFFINFEVKLSDWFYDKQIDNHIKGMIDKLHSADKKILFLVTSEFSGDLESRLSDSKQTAKDNNVYLSFITFEKYVSDLKEITNEYLSKDSIVFDMLEDLEIHIIREGLTNSWNKKLDVISCGNTKKEIENRIYCCPNNGGTHSHQRAKFFGAYWDKNVNYVSYIKAVVTLSQKPDGTNDDHIEWNNTSEKPEDLFNEARNRISVCSNDRKERILNDGWLIFILDDLKPLSFKKTSPTGMRNKRYFQVSSNSIEELVDKLDGKTWE